MTTDAQKTTGEVIREARMKAGQTDERLLVRRTAVEELPGVTEDALKKYELDINCPPNTVITMMADAYNCPELRAWYCTNLCPIGKAEGKEEIEEMPPERSVIRANAIIESIAKGVGEFAEILEDGTIDETELLELPQLRIQMEKNRNRINELLANIERAEKAGKRGRK